MARRLAVILAVGMLSGCGMSPPLGIGSQAGALQSALAASAPDEGLAAFYRSRDYRPLWVKGGEIVAEARDLVDMLARADADGIDPSRYDIARLDAALDHARSGETAAIATAEILLSRTLADHVLDLHRPPEAAAPAFLDPALPAAELTRAKVLQLAARARSLRAFLRIARRMNPVYEALRQGLADYRLRWDGLPPLALPERQLAPGMRGTRVGALRARLGLEAPSGAPARFDAELAAAVRQFQTDHGLDPTGIADVETIRALNLGPGHFEHLIRLNMDRARGLPINLGQRYILVNVATASLGLYAEGRPDGEMRVVIGRQDQQTPVMVGLMRHAVLRPYWNVPPDIARDRVAAHYAREGMAYLSRERFELLSDWTDGARRLDPAEVDWTAVAAGRLMLRVRQLPGPQNMMGRVKFMLPNPLGIYLHDTPDKTVFALPDRRRSSGCVRVEDAPRLLRWLLQSEPPTDGEGHEQRVDLPAPVPVYITYLTAVPGPGGIRFHHDVYGRDMAEI